jgi:hypothetical protein
MIGISQKDNKLKLITTDMVNTLEVIIPVEDSEEFNIAVDADKFGKLISKLTSGDVELSIDDNVLIVKSNGTYKLPIIADEEGNVSVPEIEPIKGEETTVSKVGITLAYNISRNALAQTLEQPSLTGYYVEPNRIVTSDGLVITFNEANMFGDDVTRLISPQMMNILTLFDEAEIKVVFSKRGAIQFFTDTMAVSGAQLEGLADYPIEAISGYLDEVFTSSCKISKEYMLSILDRLALFIEPYDKNGAYFTFEADGIQIHSKKDGSTEEIRYIESNKFKEFTCLVDIPLFKSQLVSIPDDSVELFYGNDTAIMIKSGKITQIVALLEDE